MIQVHGNGDGRQCGEAIAVDPDNPDIIYCGGDVNSGSSALIWSQDGGDTWEPVKGYDDQLILTCRNPITEHLHNIFDWHLHSHELSVALVGAVIYPIFQMMLIPAFVMQPRARIPLFFSLSVVRAPSPLEVSCSHRKLRP